MTCWKDGTLGASRRQGSKKAIFTSPPEAVTNPFWPSFVSPLPPAPGRRMRETSMEPSRWWQKDSRANCSANCSCCRADDSVAEGAAAFWPSASLCANLGEGVGVSAAALGSAETPGCSADTAGGSAGAGSTVLETVPLETLVMSGVLRVAARQTPSEASRSTGAPWPSCSKCLDPKRAMWAARRAQSRIEGGPSSPPSQCTPPPLADHRSTTGAGGGPLSPLA
mmetsp:Transcript_37887/g.84633  ORF Transcript_37887/g.84633 Transcript_37887/m.84633 type:complete len:224 (-) Transcript_37887:505-1176(-)